MAATTIEILEERQQHLEAEIAKEESAQDPFHLVVGSLREKKKLIAREINRLRFN